MIDKNPVIIFAGDSFTWGEGLELYTPTSKWKTQRNCENIWYSLYPKIDYDAKNDHPTLLQHQYIGESITE